MERNVMPSPALDPFFVAWDVCKRYVKKKPTNWKLVETREKEARKGVSLVGTVNTCTTS